MSAAAVFIDGDNVLPFASPNLPERIAALAVDPGSLSTVLVRIEQIVVPLGPVAIREAYGRWDNRARHLAASLLASRDYRLRHMPPLASDENETHGLKNAADILLAVRASRVTASISTVVLVAMDSDYQPLVAELRADGIQVIGVGFERSGRQSELLRATFDRFEPLPPIEGWVAIENWRRTGREPDADIPPMPMAAFVDEPVVRQRRPATAAPAPVPLASPRVAPARVPRDPHSRVDLSAVASTVVDVLPATPGDDGIPERLLRGALASFGVASTVRPRISGRLERDGHLTRIGDDEGGALSVTESFAATDRAARVRIVGDAVLLEAMADADRSPTRADNPLDARVGHVLATFNVDRDVPELMRLAGLGGS